MIVILAVYFFCLQSGLTQFAAVLFYGSGKDNQMVYALAAFYAPLYIVSGYVTGMPMMSFLLIPILIYANILGIIAVKAVHGIRWWQATVSILIPFVYVAGFVAVLVRQAG